MARRTKKSELALRSVSQAPCSELPICIALKLVTSTDPFLILVQDPEYGRKEQRGSKVCGLFSTGKGSRTWPASIVDLCTSPVARTRCAPHQSDYFESCVWVIPFLVVDLNLIVLRRHRDRLESIYGAGRAVREWRTRLHQDQGGYRAIGLSCCSCIHLLDPLSHNGQGNRYFACAEDIWSIVFGYNWNCDGLLQKG
jgi:hypothetical protein